MATTVANPQDVTTTTPGTLVDNNSQANVTNDTLKKGSAFIREARDIFAMYILYKIPNIFISTYL